MLTEQLQSAIDALKNLPPETQDRIAAVLRDLLDQPPIGSDVVRLEVIAAFERALTHSTAALDYLRDK